MHVIIVFTRPQEGFGMSVKIAEHQGTRVLYADFRGMSEQDCVEQIESFLEIYDGESGHLPMLANLEGVTLSKPFLNAANRTGKIVASKLNKQALLGVNSVVKRLIVQSFAAFTKLNVKAFQNEDDANEWLVR